MPNVIPIKRAVVTTLHGALRAATRLDHALVDQMMSRFDFSRHADYGRFLQAHLVAMHSLTGDWRDEDREDFSGMTRCLHNDLHVLGLSTDTPATPARMPFTVGNRLGVAYVIRGSRLGASVLRRRVPIQFSASYLDFVPRLTWTQFLHMLQGLSGDPNSAASREVIQGARLAFEAFAHAPQQVPA